MNRKIFLVTVLVLLTLVILGGCKGKKEDPIEEGRSGEPAVEVREEESLEVEKKAKAPLPVHQPNRPPRIISARILPDPAYTNTDLKIEVEANDREDDVVRYAYQWVKIKEDAPRDQAEELDGEISATLSHEKFIRGDVLAARITPSDWNSEGVIFQTRNVAVANSPPEITSRPPETFSDERPYAYQVQAMDPDNDQITFSLAPGAPEGMTIDPKTGLLTWCMNPGTVGTYKIQIHGNDGYQGTCFQHFTLTLAPEEMVPGEGQ